MFMSVVVMFFTFFTPLFPIRRLMTSLLFAVVVMFLVVVTVVVTTFAAFATMVEVKFEIEFILVDVVELIPEVIFQNELEKFIFMLEVTFVDIVIFTLEVMFVAEVTFIAEVMLLDDVVFILELMFEDEVIFAAEVTLIKIVIIVAIPMIFLDDTGLSVSIFQCDVYPKSNALFDNISMSLLDFTFTCFSREPR